MNFSAISLVSTICFSSEFKSILNIFPVQPQSFSILLPLPNYLENSLSHAPKPHPVRSYLNNPVIEFFRKLFYSKLFQNRIYLHPLHSLFKKLGIKELPKEF